MRTREEILRELEEKRKELRAKKRELDLFELNPEDYKEEFKEWLDECYGKIKIMGVSFWASDILEELDHTAFREGLLEFVDKINLKSVPGYAELEEEVENTRAGIEELELELEALENK